VAERGLRGNQSDRGDQRLRVDEPAQQDNSLAERDDGPLIGSSEQLGLGRVAQNFGPGRGEVPVTGSACYQTGIASEKRRPQRGLRVHKRPYRESLAQAAAASNCQFLGRMTVSMA
jgi:hypothetical protein